MLCVRSAPMDGRHFVLCQIERVNQALGLQCIASAKTTWRDLRHNCEDQRNFLSFILFKHRVSCGCLPIFVCFFWGIYCTVDVDLDFADRDQTTVNRLVDRIG